MKIMKKMWILICLLISNLSIVSVYAEESGYQYSDTATSGNVTLKVEWNEPKAGQDLTLHVSASGGSGKYKFRLAAPTYKDTNYSESIVDPTRGEYMNYTDECESHDYTFTLAASGTYYINVYFMDQTSGITYLRTETFITVSDPNYPNVNSKINDIVSQCKTNSEYQTALNLHDWIINNLGYDHSLVYSSVIGALTQGVGTCQAYEDLYKLLLNSAGITNEAKIGNGHTWNAVKLDGEWYQIDCTWDDDSVNKYYYGEPTHLYFGLTDELMALAHTDHANNYTASGYSTRSTSLVDNYYVKSGEANTWAETYRDRIQTYLDNKETSFTITADNASDPPSISGIYNGIIAYAINQLSWKSGSDYVTLTATGDSTQFTFTATYSDSSSHVHSWTSAVTKDATCTEEGIKTYTCSTCKETYTSTIDALGHDYQWIQTKDPTCEGLGSKEYKCTRCGNVSDTSIIYPNGHNYEWKITKNATCVDKGTKAYTCTTCGKVEQTQEIPATSQHSWDSGVITKQPTCNATGIKTYTCTTCNKTKTETISKLNHEYTWRIDKNPTCTTNGYKTRYCTKCGNVVETQTINSTGHNWNNSVVTKKATCSSEGIRTYTCSNCGQTRQDTIAKLSNCTVNVSYRTHVQDYGWQGWVSNGTMSGTSGQAKRLEGINIQLNSQLSGSITYQTHVQDYGWQGWVSNGTMSGTSGQSKRLEAIRIKLNGAIAEEYDVYYRVHCQDFGWLGWAKNGEASGSEGYSKRLEGIEIRLVLKGQAAPGSTSNAFVTKNVEYQTHVQDYGWQSWVADGAMSGTSGQAKRLEGINIKLSSSLNGSITYQTHVQDYGWQNWVSNGTMSGTSGQSKRLEAICIKLTGTVAQQYDVYYRVHCQDLGWLGWAKNGEASGSEGLSKRLEGIEIRLVPKGQGAPGSTNKHFVKG